MDTHGPNHVTCARKAVQQHKIVEWNTKKWKKKKNRATVMLMNLRILCSRSFEYVTISYGTLFVERMNRCLMSVATVHLVAHLLIHHLLWRRNIMLLLLHIRICRWWPIGDFLRKTANKQRKKNKNKISYNQFFLIHSDINI